jgi:hypothetical protein
LNLICTFTLNDIKEHNTENQDVPNTYICTLRFPCSRRQIILAIRDRANIINYSHSIRSITVWPDWANFFPLCDCFLLAVFFKLQKSTKFFGCFVPQKRFVCINLTKMSWVAFFAIFSTNSSGHPDHKANQAFFTSPTHKLF